MDEGDQMALVQLFPPVEARVMLTMGENGLWSAHFRVRRESWSWAEATVDYYERLTLPSLMDVLSSMETSREDR